MAEAAVQPNGWERALLAAEKVKERLSRATRALDAAGIPSAVAGGNAVNEVHLQGQDAEEQVAVGIGDGHGGVLWLAPAANRPAASRGNRQRSLYHERR